MPHHHVMAAGIIKECHSDRILEAGSSLEHSRAIVDLSVLLCEVKRHGEQEGDGRELQCCGNPQTGKIPRCVCLTILFDVFVVVSQLGPSGLMTFERHGHKSSGLTTVEASTPPIPPKPITRAEVTLRFECCRTLF